MNKYILGKQKTLAELCQKKDEQIKLLWSLLDDISTAGDMFKPEINSYFRYVEGKCEARTKVANSDDGHTLKTKGCMVANPTHITTEALKSVVESLLQDGEDVKVGFVEDPVFLIHSYVPLIEPVIISSPQRKRGKKGKNLKDWQR